MALDENRPWMIPGTIERHVLLDSCESRTPPNNTIGITSSPAHPHLHRLDVEICSAEDLRKPAQSP